VRRVTGQTAHAVKVLNVKAHLVNRKGHGPREVGVRVEPHRVPGCRPTQATVPARWRARQGYVVAALLIIECHCEQRVKDYGNARGTRVEVRPRVGEEIV